MKPSLRIQEIRDNLPNFVKENGNGSGYLKAIVQYLDEEYERRACEHKLTSNGVKTWCEKCGKVL